MTIRTIEIHECDGNLCRRRKGVAKVEIALTVRDYQNQPLIVLDPAEAPVDTLRLAGELCPHHVKLLRQRIVGAFANAKGY